MTLKGCTTRSQWAVLFLRWPAMSTTIPVRTNHTTVFILLLLILSHSWCPRGTFYVSISRRLRWTLLIRVSQKVTKTRIIQTSCSCITNSHSIGFCLAVIWAWFVTTIISPKILVHKSIQCGAIAAPNWLEMKKNTAEAILRYSCTRVRSKICFTTL